MQGTPDDNGTHSATCLLRNILMVPLSSRFEEGFAGLFELGTTIVLSLMALDRHAGTAYQIAARSSHAWTSDLLRFPRKFHQGPRPDVGYQSVINEVL
jgi:hypothetical protein